MSKPAQIDHRVLACVYWGAKANSFDPYEMISRCVAYSPILFVNVKEYNKVKDKLSKKGNAEYLDDTLVILVPHTRLPKGKQKVLYA